MNFTEEAGVVAQREILLDGQTLHALLEQSYLGIFLKPVSKCDGHAARLTSSCFGSVADVGLGAHCGDQMPPLIPGMKGVARATGGDPSRV